MPHCDKANNFEYDIGCLLYLSTSGVNFTGGNFIFMDMVQRKSAAKCIDESSEDVLFERAVQPVAGRFLLFSNTWEHMSVHRMAPVLTGDRLLLSAWYTVS